jgi:4-amino-4-deoxy-L-arabinose transferase-like glycosyltransferase
MKSRNTIFLLIIFCITTFFVNRSALPTDIMESRNIVTAREIVSDGNWLLPTMNGELRLEKPPLPTWVAGLMEMVAPNNLSAQRFAPAIMGFDLDTFLVFDSKISD